MHLALQLQNWQKSKRGQQYLRLSHFLSFFVLDRVLVISSIEHSINWKLQHLLNMVTFSSLGKAVPTLVLMTLALAQPSLQNPTYTTPAAGLQTFTFTQPVYSTPAVGLTTQEVSTRVVTSVIPVETVKSGGDLASELQIIVKEIEKLLGSLIGVITITAEVSWAFSTHSGSGGVTDIIRKFLHCSSPLSHSF